MKKNISRPKKYFAEEKKEFEQKVIDIARVTRVVAGGKRMRFRACVVIGDLKGRLGVGVKKGADVSVAVNKAVNEAKKNLTKIKTVNETIPHEVRIKHKSALLLIKPAPKGTGIIAGGPVRAALEISGIKNIVAKMIGSKNKINNVRALIEALSRLKEPRQKAEKKSASAGGKKLEEKDNK